MATYAYIRVSTKEQNEGRQLAAIDGMDIPNENIYIDKQSGKDFQRPEYQQLIQRLKRDDLLVVKSIDRLGRDYGEIIQQWQLITKDTGADILVLDMPLLDTRLSKDLLGTFIADLVLQLLSFVAENERENIRQRQQEGIMAAKKRGVRFGRPRKGVPENFADYAKRWGNGSMSAACAAKAVGMPESTFKRYALAYLKQTVTDIPKDRRRGPRKFSSKQQPA